jgi:hypothetical protein
MPVQRSPSTRDATEVLIAKGLVRGERLKGADGIYFNDLKLTPFHRPEAEPPISVSVKCVGDISL